MPLLCCASKCAFSATQLARTHLLCYTFFCFCLLLLRAKRQWLASVWERSVSGLPPIFGCWQSRQTLNQVNTMSSCHALMVISVGTNQLKTVLKDRDANTEEFLGIAKPTAEACCPRRWPCSRSCDTVLTSPKTLVTATHSWTLRQADGKRFQNFDEGRG